MADVVPHRHYPGLDGVRGLAVLTVMVLHFTLFTPATGVERVLAGVFSAGWIGVDLFFVLSGFLITGILIDSRRDPHFFRNFYARRTLRIFPLYYAYLVLLFLVLPALSGAYAAEHATWDRRGWFWLYLGNVLMGMHGWDGMPGHTTHLWSLAVEEQFYLVWPLIMYVVPERRRVLLCITTILTAWVMRGLLVAYQEPAAAYVLTFARMDTLAAGALVAVMLREQGEAGTRRLGHMLLASGGVFTGGTLLWNALQRQFRPLEALDPQTQLLGYGGIAFLFAGFIAFVVTGDRETSMSRWLRAPWLRMFGKYSYALYLVHVPIRNLFRSLLERYGPLQEIFGSQLPAQLAIYCVGIAVSLGISFASWHLFEKHFLRLKDCFASAPTIALRPSVTDVASAPIQPSAIHAGTPTRP